jgi:DNA-binding transcriptional ArsR family regulator
LAFADPVRRAILARLDDEDLLVEQPAHRFAISLQAVPRHIQVLVKARLVTRRPPPAVGVIVTVDDLCTIDRADNVDFSQMHARPARR